MKIRVHSLFLVQKCYHTNLKKRDAFLNVSFFVSTKIKTAGSYSKIAEPNNLPAEKQITKDVKFDLQVLCRK